MELSPVHAPLLTAPVQPLIKQLHCQSVVPHNPAIVAAHSIVLIMSSELGAQNWPPYLRLHVSGFLQPELEVTSLGGKFLARRFMSDFEATLAISVAVVGEPQKIKRSCLHALSSSFFLREPAKTNELGFVFSQ